ncbi:MAG TPA: metallophosphoesterase family protein [Ignavibacteria bacterium]|jgi:predicted phosphodiesterase
MIYAIISDVHANLEATEACFREIDKIKPDKIICLGDLVDYCAEPNDVIELVSSRCDVIIIGNHDEAQIDYSIAEGFTNNARTSSIHTRSVLKKEYKDFISALPRSFSENNLLFVHASPFYLPEYGYILDEYDARENFTAFKESFCFIGHSHIPVIFEESKGKVREIESAPERNKRYIINVGSVGQPRDGNSKLAFGIFDTDNFEFRLIRADYDIKSAAQKIVDEGLPFRLAERLFAGL